MIRYGQHPSPTHVVAHLSDTHLLAGGARQFGVIDTDQWLVRALERLRYVDPPPQAIVLTGDLADRGEPDAYRRLRDLITPMAAAWGAQIVWCIGNHDRRENYAAELFGETTADPAASHDRVYDVAGLRIISLDTIVPGWNHGELTEAQLAWLGGVLAKPAPHGTILAMHHPPIPSPMVPQAEIIELFDQERLAEVVRGSDVRSILAGHFHTTSHSTFAGVPVSVAGATCNLSDPAPLDRLLSSVEGNTSFNMVHAYDDRVVHTICPVPEAPEVNGYGLDMLPVIESMSWQERHENISRMDSEFNRADG